MEDGTAVELDCSNPPTENIKPSRFASLETLRPIRRSREHWHAKYRGVRRTLRCLAIDHVVARLAVNGSARYSSVRSSFTRRRNTTRLTDPFASAPLPSRMASQPSVNRQQARSLDYYVISTSSPSWRTYVGRPQTLLAEDVRAAASTTIVSAQLFHPGKTLLRRQTTVEEAKGPWP
jgi:hypothetical protein